MNLVLYVDDMKISHVSPDEVANMIGYLKRKYANDGIGQMKVSRGKVHEYLSMTQDFTEKGIVKVNMVDYVKIMLENFPEDVKTASSQVSDFLFKVDNEAKKLNEDLKQQYHTPVAKGFFSMQADKTGHTDDNCISLNKSAESQY